MEMEYSASLVQESFRVLSSPLSSAQQRQQANDILLKFQVECTRHPQSSPKALEIAFELLDSSLMESQYLGAQVVYQKVRLEFDGSDQEIFEFKNMLFDQLKSNKKLHVKVVERLCYSLACLGAKTFLIWDAVIAQFLDFAKSTEMDTGIFLLSIFPSEQDALLLPRSHQIQLQQLMRENANALYTLAIEVLKSEGASEYAKHAALHCASEWVDNGHWLTAHSQACLFFLGFLNEKQYALQAMQLFTNYLQRNQFAKILEQASLSKAIKDYPTNLSETIVQLSYYFKNVVLPNLSQIQDDAFILKLADLVMAIASNHAIALIEENEVSSSLFETLLVFLSHPSETILTHCLQFWNQFRITLRQLPDLEERLFLVEKFYIMAKCVIPRLKQPLLAHESISEENINYEDDASYLRMVSADALFSAFFLMSQYLKDEGVDQFFSLLTPSFNASESDEESYISELEVVYFVMQSVLDGVDSTQKSIVYYRESCLMLEKVPLHPILTKQCLLFAEEVGKHFSEVDDLQEPILSFIIRAFSVKQCQDAAVSTLEELVTKEIPYSAQKVKLLQDTFTSELAGALERNSLSKLSQCIVLLMRQVNTGKDSDQQFAEDVVALATPFSNFVREGQGSSDEVSKSIAIVASISKKVYECSSDQVSYLLLCQIASQVLFKIGSDLVQPVLSLLSSKEISSADLIASCCKFLVVMCECLASQMADGINEILLTLLQAMNSSPKLSVIGLSLPKIIDSLGPIKAAASKLSESFEPIASSLIDRINATKDPTDVEIFSSFVAKCVLYNRAVVIESSSIQQIVQICTACMQAYENPEVRKALYSFWDCLACTEPDFFSPFASYAVQAMLDGIKRMHSRVLFDASNAFKDLLANHLDTVIPLIEEHLSRSDNFSLVNKSILSVFVKGIVTFRSDRFKMKRILQDLQQVVDGEAKGDNFVALEVEIAMKKKKKNLNN